MPGAVKGWESAVFGARDKKLQPAAGRTGLPASGHLQPGPLRNLKPAGREVPAARGQSPAQLPPETPARLLPLPPPRAHAHAQLEPLEAAPRLRTRRDQQKRNQTQGGA